MRDILIRKGLVVGIIALFIGAGVVPSISGNEKSDTINISHQDNDKPDLKIVDVKIEYHGSGYPGFILYVKNIGTIGVPGGWRGVNRLTFKELFRNISVLSETYTTYGTNQPHNPGEIKENFIGYIDVTYLFIIFLYRIFFEVDPYNDVDESNENNNIVWAYIFGHWWWRMPQYAISCSLIMGSLRAKPLWINCG